MPPQFHVRITGTKSLRRVFKQLRRSAQIRAARDAVKAGLSPVNKAAKQNAKKVQDTGLLWKSIGARVLPRKKTTNKNLVVGFVGPRPGKEGMVNGKKRNPVRYAHLVEFGTKPHKIKPQSGRTLRLGRNLFVRGSVNHPGVTAQPFLRPAFDGRVGAAKLAMAKAFRKSIAREVLRAHKRGAK